MKTMTCRQLGGPCDHEHRGANANDVIKLQDAHLNEAEAAGDSTHEPALVEMKRRWKRPVSGMAWYRKAKRDFGTLRES